MMSHGLQFKFTVFGLVYPLLSFTPLYLNYSSPHMCYTYSLPYYTPVCYTCPPLITPLYVTHSVQGVIFLQVLSPPPRIKSTAFHDHSCPNIKELSSMSTVRYAETIRSPLKNYVELKCPKPKPRYSV